jgi:hypothetical protein
MVAIPMGFALLVHGRSIGFPFVSYDDPMHFLTSPLVIDPGGQSLIEHLKTQRIGYPIPLTVLTYVVDHALFGFRPWWFHLVNVILHLANVALVVVLANRLRMSRWAAVLAATWFAIHPLVVEPVCWVTGRKDLLATGLSLAAILLAMTATSARRWTGLVAIDLLAMLSKPTVAVLPAALWLVAPRSQRNTVWAACLAALNLALCVLGVVIVRTQQPLGSTPISEVAHGTVGALALAGRNLLWPLGLAPSYSQWDDDPSPVAIGVTLVGLVLLGVWAWRRTPRASAERFGLCLAACAYLPVSGVAGHNRWFADSYLYLPLVGLTITAAAALGRRFADRDHRAAFAIGLAGAVSLSAVSFAQTDTWRSSDAVWRTVEQRYPKNPVAVSELAAALDWLGRPREAKETYLRLDEQFPDFPQILLPRVAVRLERGEIDRARALLLVGVRSGGGAESAEYLRLRLMDRTGRLRGTQEDLRMAFDRAWPRLSATVHDPAVLEQLALLLGSEGLAPQARVVRASLPPAAR